MKSIAVYSKNPRRLLSLDCGQGYTKIAYVQVSGDSAMRLLASQVWEMPSNAMAKQEFAASIREFLARHAIRSKQVYLTISDMEAIVVKDLLMPVLSEGETREALKWQLKDQLPFSFDEACVERQVQGMHVDADGARHNDILCVLAKEQLVQQYVGFVKACGLVPAKVSISPVNYAALLKLQGASPGVTAVLDIGFKDATLSLYDHAELFFVRNLAFSSDKLTNALCGALHAQSGTIQLSYKQAEEVKVAYGILQDASGMLEGQIPAMHVISLMRPLLESLVKELARSFDYFTAAFKKDAPGALYITGGGANLKHLGEYLTRELSLPVAVLPVPAFSDEAAQDALLLQTQCASVLGACLGEADKGINLLPSALRVRKFESAQRISLVIAAGMLALAMFLFLAAVSYKTHRYQDALRRVQARLVAISSIKEFKQEIDRKERLVALIQQERVSEEALLKLVGAYAGPGIMVQELIFDQSSHAMTLKGIVVVPGPELTAEAVLTDYIKKMKSSPLIGAASLVNSENKNGTQEFELHCDLRTSS